jgi:hypothetical protein
MDRQPTASNVSPRQNIFRSGESKSAIPPKIPATPHLRNNLEVEMEESPSKGRDEH